MWRLVLLTVLLLGTVARPTVGQEWRGTAAVGLSGGYHTNLYLDPVLGSWNPDVPSFFLATTPQLGLTRDARRTRIDVTVQGHFHPRRNNVPRLTQTTLRIRRRLASNWTLGLVGGGTRYRYPALQETPRTARDSWWALPSLRWAPTSKTMLTLRTGLTQRYEHLPTLTDRQTSGLVSLRATHWLADRVQGGLRLYYSSGRTSTAETGFGGSGGALSTTYWPVSSLSIKGEAAVEQLRYETLQPAGTTRDRIGRAGLEARWSPRSSITVFGRARALTAQLGTASSRIDVHASAGLRLQTQTVFGGTTEPPPQRRVCQNTENGLRIKVPYDGEGQVHVTGDFNNWSLPGIPLEPTDDDIWRTTLTLPSGRYAYRLRVVQEDHQRWLDLPSYAQTAKDPFGGTNGVCTAQ